MGRLVLAWLIALGSLNAEAVQLLDLTEEQQQEAQRKLDEQHALIMEAAPLPPAPINAPDSPPLRKANITWGATLNPGGHASVGMFKVFYINTKDPRTVIASDYVTDIAINYPFNEFHKIPSENFGAYWIGKLRFKQTQDKAINFGYGRAKARIIVDGQIIHEGENGASIPYRFTAGEHLLEVEYINNWHTTDFKLSITDQLVRLNTTQARGELRRANALNLPAHYLMVYESKRQDMSITVDATQLRGDAVVVLSSYSPVKWILENTQSARIKAVIVASQHPGSEVTGVRSADTLILAHAGWVGTYNSEARCHCTAGSFHCDDPGSIITTQSAAAILTAGNLTSLGGVYAGDRLSLPDTLVTAAVIEKAKAQQQQKEVERQRCESDANPDFERIMKGK